MIIVRYGEIGLKSKGTRSTFERKLIENIKAALDNGGVTREYGRIYVESDSREDAVKVARVFGVVSTSVAVKVNAELEELLEKGVAYAKKRIKAGQSFAVRARRVGKHSYTSIELARELGARIVEVTGVGVNLSNPEVEIHVEVRDRDAYIYDEVIRGVGGLPLGTQGKALALISGGIDSPVAAWMMMKRGADIIALFMDPSPLVDERTIKRAMASIEKLTAWKNEAVKTYIVPYGEVLIELLKAEDAKLGCVLCKRAMYRAAQLIAEQEKAKALITGESLGQVASQTMENLAVIDDAVSMLVYRPLIGYDKEEIIQIAKEIGTYEISIMPANCCLGPPRYPETKATLGRVRKAEDEVDALRLVGEMCERARMIEVGKV
ncbi:MAG: tRNA uracil 4-sulfurtransferase ThiI [Candidatus Hydrothermarchaeota archaeon]|nr:tRNA uracil 4-sulfurtransferase ThiI [Candidatus Hydrothermarchaeota archaeon]